jgi:hypothetical protein
MIDFIFTGDISPRIQGIALGLGILMLLFIVELIRGGRLKEGYALLWLGISLVTLAFALFPQLLTGLAGIFGVVYAPSAFLLLLVGGLYLLAIHFSLLLHRYDKRIRGLAQEHAILKQQTEEKTRRLKKNTLA